VPFENCDLVLEEKKEEMHNNNKENEKVEC